MDPWDDWYPPAMSPSSSTQVVEQKAAAEAIEALDGYCRYMNFRRLFHGLPDSLWGREPLTRPQQGRLFRWDNFIATIV